MSVDSQFAQTLARNAEVAKRGSSRAPVDLEIALLTGGQDKSYALGLAMALSSKGMRVNVIGNDLVDSEELHTNPNLTFHNIGGIQQPNATFLRKLFQLMRSYVRLIKYIATAKPRLFHILWNNKFEYFDRTFLMLFFKLMGKRVVFTAHNVNKAERDLEDSQLNRLTLRCQYQLADRIFVHTEKMKSELVEGFSVNGGSVRVIPFGVYDVLPNTNLTTTEAKKKLGIGSEERAILFFGRIVPYKGLEYLLAAFETLCGGNPNYRLIIAGEPMKGYEHYTAQIVRTIENGSYRDRVIQKLQFISDEETEMYCKAADVLVLPYRYIFQSGVLFVGYTYGLPVIGADVGSFREDIIEGKTGYVFKPSDSSDLANTIEKYFDSGLYRELERNRREIRDYVTARHSWETVGSITRNVYQELLKGSTSNLK